MRSKDKENPVARLDIIEGVHKLSAEERGNFTGIGNNFEAVITIANSRKPASLRAGLWCCFLEKVVLSDDE